MFCASPDVLGFPMGGSMYLTVTGWSNHKMYSHRWRRTHNQHPYNLQTPCDLPSASQALHYKLIKREIKTGDNTCNYFGGSLTFYFKVYMTDFFLFV